MSVQLIYDYKVENNEFGSYLFGFKTHIILKKNKKLKVGNMIRLFEYDSGYKCFSGRNLMFEIVFIEKSSLVVQDEQCWLLSLKKH